MIKEILVQVFFVITINEEVGISEMKGYFCRVYDTLSMKSIETSSGSYENPSYVSIGD